MDFNQCPSCQNQYDQEKRVSKQLPCGCVSCLQCYKIIFQVTKKIECAIHQKVYNINPEKLQTFVVQEPILQELPQPQEQFIVQEQINEQFRYLQDQYKQKLNHNSEIIKVIQDSSLFMKYIQQLAIKEIMKSLIDQFSMSNERIKNLLQRLSELQVVNKIYQQQQQNLILGQQDPRLRQSPQGQLQQQFQQILREIEELKKEQWMDIQSLRVNVQRCMFGMFVYLSENSGGQLLSDSKAELLLQKYFNQVKVSSILSQVSNSLVQQQGQQQFQNIDQQLSQERQNIDYQQYQNQVIDRQQGQDMVQDKQFFVQFLTQIKNENMSLQALQISPLNKQKLIEYPQVLQQLSVVTDQQICLRLFQILDLSKNQPQIQQAAANSLALLNFMNYDFSNQDFANLDLSSSDLSDATFTNCNFSNSNLSQANLRNSKFINCDLSNANLTSIITEHPHIFTGHIKSVTSVSISSDSNIIFSGSFDRTIILWDIKTGESKTMSGHTGLVTSVSISNDSEFIVSGSKDSTIILWNIKTGESKTMSGHKKPVTSVSISNDSQYIVSGSFDFTIILWNIKTGESKNMSGHTGPVTSVSISNDQKFIISGSLDSTIRLWSTKSLECIKVLSGHTDRVTSVSISNDQQFIISGSRDCTIRLWSTKSQECIKVLKGHSDDVYSVIFSFDSKYIISGSKDKTIRVWSIQSGECLCTICGHTEVVGSLSLSRDNNWLVSSNGSAWSYQTSDYNFRRWNLGRLLNVSGEQQQNQLKMDWTRVYGDYGLGFKDCVVNNIVMSVEDRECYIK